MRNAKQAPSSWASMMAGYPLLLTLLGLVLLPVSALQAQVTRNASNFAEFQAAVTASAASGDTINLTNNIVATSATTLSKSLTIRGNGRVISVPVPGLDESGVVVTGASTHRIFTISGASVVVRIEETTLLGGNVSGGGALDVSTGATLRLVGSTVTRSRSSAGGGGIRVSGANSRAVIENSRILRNSAQFGGGFINSSSATMHIDRSLIAENRSESANGGGGGGEEGVRIFV